jgi:hypothetical protein
MDSDMLVFNVHSTHPTSSNHRSLAVVRKSECEDAVTALLAGQYKSAELAVQDATPSAKQLVAIPFVWNDLSEVLRKRYKGSPNRRYCCRSRLGAKGGLLFAESENAGNR